MRLTSGGDLALKPFLPLPTPAEDEQPFFWTGKYGWGGVLTELSFTLGYPDVNASLEKTLCFSVHYNFTGEDGHWWRFEAPAVGYSPVKHLLYPRENVEAALRGHVDPLLQVRLAHDLEDWHYAMVEAVRATAKIHDRRPHELLENAPLAAWLRSHNGFLAMEWSQRRSAKIQKLLE